VFAEPQVRHRGLRFVLPHPTAGQVPGVRNPVRFGRTPVEYGRPPPLLGADTAAELKGRLGLDERRWPISRPAASSRETRPVQRRARRSIIDG